MQITHADIRVCPLNESETPRRVQANSQSSTKLRQFQFVDTFYVNSTRDLWTGLDPNEDLIWLGACIRITLRKYSNTFVFEQNVRDRSTEIWNKPTIITDTPYSVWDLSQFWLIPRKHSHRRLLFVVFPLRNFDGRLSRYMTHEKIHQNVLAIIRLFDGFQHQRTQPFVVQIIKIPMIKCRSGEHDRVLVRPFRRITPRILENYKYLK